MTTDSFPSVPESAVAAGTNGSPIGANAEDRIVIIGVGGTIAMRVDAEGSNAAPGAQPDASMFPIPGVTLDFREVANVGSPSLQVEHIVAALREADAAVADGARGVVITHGTDTLEETAFFLNRFWPHEAPLVVTGAMRPANAPGADGPENLHDSIIAAASDNARGLGVLAVFDSLVHSADRVTKASSRSVDAFASEPSGPLAIVNGRSLTHVYALPPAPARLPLSVLLCQDSSGPTPSALPTVPVLGVGLFDHGEALAALLGAAGGASEEGTAADVAAEEVAAVEGAEAKTGHEPRIAGLVTNGVGMGHVPETVVPLVRRAVESGITVVVATRIPEGGTSTHHYSYPGSEVDLIRNGAIMAGSLSAHKARILLQALLAAGSTKEQIAQEFAAFAY